MIFCASVICIDPLILVCTVYVLSYNMDNPTRTCTIVQMSDTASKIKGRGEARRELILDTTLRMIATGGVDSVTHRRVAEAADIPLGSTTYYFDSREHLLREAFDHYLARATRLQADAASKPITSVAAFVNYLWEIISREFEDEAMLLAEYEMTLFAARDDLVAASLHAWDERMLKHIGKTMKSLGASRPKDAAQTVLNLMRGYELDSLSRHEPDSENFKRRLKVVVAGLIASQ